MGSERTNLRHILFIMVALLLCSCNNTNHHAVLKQKIIVIQPFSDFPEKEAITVYQKIKLIYPQTVLEPGIAMPVNAYYAPRNRYRADTIIRYLSSLGTKDKFIIGLTAKDISTTKNGKGDWGIMGLGYCPGKSCVASTFRLSKENKATQFYKVAIHELGHTEGLPHCKDSSCFMRDAAGGNPLNEEQDFCVSCKSFLIRKGWALK